MTNDKEKEQLRNKFHKVYLDFCEDGSSKNLYDVVVNFCYSEIEERERSHSEKKCSTHCDWPNCTLEGCRQEQIDRENHVREQERQRVDIDLLERYSNFLSERGYMDDDWWSEKPSAIEEFLKEESSKE